MGENVSAPGLGGEWPWGGCWSGCRGRGGVSEVLLGGLLWGTMARCGEVIDEGMLWVGARVEVGLVGCVEGGVEILSKFGVM